MKILPNRPFSDYGKWMEEQVAEGSRIGVDPALVSGSSGCVENVETVEKIVGALKKKGAWLKLIDENLVDKACGVKGEENKSQVYIYDIKYCGKSSSDKLKELHHVLRRHGCNVCVVAMLDQIAWLLNLRGGDIPFNPVFKSYLVIYATGDRIKSTLYSDVDKFRSKEIRDYLKEMNMQLKLYEDITSDLKAIKNATIGLELSTLNVNVIYKVKADNRIVDLKQEVACLKARKTQAELNGYRNCHIKDAVGLVKYLAWLRYQLNDLHRTDITEYMGAEKMLEFRKAQDKFMGLSFATISAIGPNASIIHYKPERNGSVINNKEVYLLDSGAQYMYCSCCL
eukprot:TRINITY_DN1711_c0_g1_i1.p1 TRINITY_DN1711_c0_g1~~TRINITY_DN1711_c0_g1_i1.p1  ORF type:complete len:340 (-),score=51.81 TRINITY_DN1711_c0_g1_i1:745-1764(-)